MKKAIALLLCAVLCLSPCLTAGAAYGKPFSRIGDVLFYGGRLLEEIDLSALIDDPDTCALGALFLCRVYGDPAEAIETQDYDRVANFEFTGGGKAVLSDYPGASAPIDPGVYALFSPNGDLFDDVPYYAFSAKDYYKNASPDAGGITLCRVGLPSFSGYTVTKADGDVVYEMQMTLEEDLVSFYDTFDPNARIAIDCKYGYADSDTFCTVEARPMSFDFSTGLLTIELLSADGTAGTVLHNFRANEDDYGYVFKFTFFPGLFSCGAAQSAHAFMQISGKVIDGLPQRVFTRDDAIGQMFEKLCGKLWSEKRVRRVGAMTLLAVFALPVFAQFMHNVFRSVRAFDGDAVDTGRDAFRRYLKRLWDVGLSAPEPEVSR